MKERIREFLQNVLENEDHEATWFFDFATHNGKRWALVAAWMDYNDEDDWCVYCKLAYQPTNSLMQEYGIDWLMPVNSNGDCDDTELCLGNEKKVSDFDVAWIIKEWDRFKEEYVYTEDNEDDE